jgi:hypothetical protein
MKKLIVILLVCIGGSAIAANGTYKPVKKKSGATKAVKAKLRKAKAPKPFCRVCCEVTVMNESGTMGATVESCAGWLLTSCETAATRACAKAEAAAEALINPGG